MKEVSRLENLTKDFERELDQVKLFKIFINHNNNNKIFSSFVIQYEVILIHYNQKIKI